ncbi:hypothetical protein, partial [Xanthovirga aplysinae]|uniref:hypothetical protein n=1 Tax=Xanthovirga aplysinae TaxID=2529853 RepID=UPI00165763D1
NIDGKYKGTFEKEGIVANVEVSLHEGNFSGESDKGTFPSIYYGDFSVQNWTINFENKRLVITADITPGLVLNGQWNYQIEDNTLTMTNSIGDIYILNKQ